jgi:hypothetical protein
VALPLREETFMRDKCLVEKRRGYVLLTVTLVGALLFVSALMFVSQLTTESHVTKTDAYFKSALNLAETGMANVLMDIKSSEGSARWAELFSGGGDTLAAVEGLAVHGTYQVTVAVVGRKDLGGGLCEGEVQVTSIGAVYPPSVTAMIGSGDYVARRAVRMNTVATWTETKDPDKPPRWEYTGPPGYAIFSGTDVGIKASSQVIGIGGDIWANGDITIGNYRNGGKNSGFPDGKAYTGSGGITGLPVDKMNLRQGNKTPPPINIDGQINPATTPDKWGYRALFDAYVMGTFPFNAVGQLNYPGRYIDMSTNTLEGQLNRARYQVQALLDFAVPSGVTDPNNVARKLLVLPSSENVSADVRSAMTNPLGVYFFNGDVKKLPSDTDLAGTIVINGKLETSSGAELGSSAKPLVLVVTNNVERQGGGIKVNGIVHVGGQFSGSGNASIVGRLISGGEVDMEAHTFVIEYVPGINPIGGVWKFIPGTAGEGTVYDLVLFDREVDGARMWQEVPDLN